MSPQGVTSKGVNSQYLTASRLLPGILMLLRAATLVVKFVFTLFISKYLGFEALGVYGLVVAAGIIAPALLGLGIMPNISRGAVHQPLAETRGILKRYMHYLGYVYIAIACVAIAVAMYQQQIMLAILILCIIFFEHLNGEFYQLLINLQRPLLADSLHFLRSAFWSLVFMAGAVVYSEWRSVHGLFLAWLIGSGICVLVYTWIFFQFPRKADVNISLWKWLAGQLKNSRALYVNGIATTGNGYSDRYLIGLFINLELTGVYLFFWQMQSALSNLIYTGLLQLARPGLIKSFKNGDADYWQKVHQLLRNTLVISIVFSIMAFATIYIALPFLNMPLATAYLPLFALILVACIFNLIAEAQVLVFYSQYQDTKILITTTLVFTLGFVACLIAIPLWGLWGAAVAAILSASARVAFQAYFIGTFKNKIASFKNKKEESDEK